MKRLLSGLLSGRIAAISLVLFLITAGAWFFSYLSVRKYHDLDFGNGRSTLWDSSYGQLTVSYSHRASVPIASFKAVPPLWTGIYSQRLTAWRQQIPPQLVYGMPGLSIARYPMMDGDARGNAGYFGTAWRLEFPESALPIAFAFLPTIFVIRRKLKRKDSPQIDECSHCGYDLRATPERCPECGAAPSVVLSNPENTLLSS